MTQTVTIDGSTVTRDDGSEVCIGYYEDSQGRVIDRFAVPPGTYEVKEAVSTVNYVSSMDNLPPVDSHYTES